MKTKHTWIVSPNEAREARLMGLFFQEKSLNDQLNNLKGKAGDDLIDEIQEQILQVEEDLSEIEIAVIRSDNKHGINSCGWEDEKKIIFQGDTYNAEMFMLYMKAAKTIAKSFNEEG